MSLLLEDDCIRLRALEPEDLSFLYEMENDTSLWHCGVTNVPYSRYALRQYLSETRNDLFADGQLRLVIVAKETSEPVGLLDLMDYDARHARAEVGIVVRSDYRRRRVAYRSLRLLAHYAATHLFMHQLYAVVDEENVSMCRLLMQSGYRCIAELPDWLRRSQEEYGTALQFQLLL